MTTDEEKLTTVEETEQNSEEELMVVDQIARRLDESEPKAIEGIRRIVTMLGTEPALSLLDDALKIDREGGLMTDDGNRQRTIGGVYFKLAKNTMSQEQRSKLFVPPWWPKDKPDEIPQYDWAERIEDVHQIQGGDRGHAEMEIRMTGIPAKIIDRGSAILLVMMDKPPTTFPKGLPALPEGKQPVSLAIVVKKQWEEIEDKIEKGHRVSLVGYPIYDDKLKQITILTKTCKAVKPRKPKPEKEAVVEEGETEEAEPEETAAEESPEIVAEQETEASVAEAEEVEETAEEETSEVIEEDASDAEEDDEVVEEDTSDAEENDDSADESDDDDVEEDASDDDDADDNADDTAADDDSEDEDSDDK